jgi:hypothetical protein
MTIENQQWEINCEASRAKANHTFPDITSCKINRNTSTSTPDFILSQIRPWQWFVFLMYIVIECHSKLFQFFAHVFRHAFSKLCILVPFGR